MLAREGIPAVRPGLDNVVCRSAYHDVQTARSASCTCSGRENLSQVGFYLMFFMLSVSSQIDLTISHGLCR